MTMRISSQMVTSRVLLAIQNSRRRLFEVQQQVGSGIRINRPADDPLGVRQLLMERTQLEQSEQYRRNVDVASSDLAVAEAALTSVNDLLQRAIELAVQGANGTIGAQERTDIALEVSELLTQAIAVGNKEHSGRFIFAGLETATAPFVPDDPTTPTVVTYAGDTGSTLREISRSVRIASNITGDRGFPAVFTALMQFRDNLLANNVAAIGADPSQLTSALDTIHQLRSEIGSKVRRIESAGQRLLDEEVMTRSILSSIEDADLAEGVVQLQVRETAYQAALGAAGRALSLSLLEFLR